LHFDIRKSCKQELVCNLSRGFRKILQCLAKKRLAKNHLDSCVIAVFSALWNEITCSSKYVLSLSIVGGRLAWRETCADIHNAALIELFCRNRNIVIHFLPHYLRLVLALPVAQARSVPLTLSGSF